MPVCRRQDGSEYPVTTEREQAMCEQLGGSVQPDGPPGVGVPIGCGGKFVALAGQRTGLPENMFYESFRAIAFSQLQHLRDAYLARSGIGQRAIRLNILIEEKAAPIIVEREELLSEAMFLLTAACHFANAIIACKLRPGKCEGPRFSRELYDRTARLAREVRQYTSDPELQASIDFALAALKLLVGFSARQVLRFLEASAALGD